MPSRLCTRPSTAPPKLARAPGTRRVGAVTGCCCCIEPWLSSAGAAGWACGAVEFSGALLVPGVAWGRALPLRRSARHTTAAVFTPMPGDISAKVYSKAAQGNSHILEAGSAAHDRLLERPDAGSTRLTPLAPEPKSVF